MSEANQNQGNNRRRNNYRGKRRNNRWRGRGKRNNRNTDAAVQNFNLENDPIYRRLKPKDLLYKKSDQKLSPRDRDIIRSKYKLEKITKYSKPNKSAEDYRTIYEKMEFLDYEIEAKLKSNDSGMSEAPIGDYYSVLTYDKNDEKLVTIDEIIEELKKEHTLEPNQQIFYYGNGSFAICEMKKIQPKRRRNNRNRRRNRFNRDEKPENIEVIDKVVKRIQYENRKLTMHQLRMQQKN